MKKTFTIGTSTIPGEVILPHLMPKILQRNPDISLKLIVTNSRTTFESVRKGEIEVGIIGTRYDSDDVTYQTVIQNDRLVLIAPKDDPLTKKNPLTIDDLRGRPFVNRETGSGTRATYERAFQEAGLSLNDLNIVAEISDTEGVIQAVQAGTGLAVVSEIAARTSDCQGDIAILETPFDMTRNFYIITHKTNSPAPLTQEVVRYLVEVFQQR
jgi:DNA-binding transcriptional LysR family regulator